MKVVLSWDRFSLGLSDAPSSRDCRLAAERAWTGHA